MSSEPYVTTDRSAILQAALDNLIAFVEDFLTRRQPNTEGLGGAVLHAKAELVRLNKLAIPEPDEPEIQKHGSEERMDFDPLDIPVSRRDLLELLHTVSEKRGGPPTAWQVITNGAFMHLRSKWGKR